MDLRSDTFLLSYPQERFWLLHEMEPRQASNRAIPAARLRGPLDVRALEQCLDRIVARHEALRTVFPVVDGVPRQAVLPPFPVGLVLQDLGGLPAEEREAEAERRMRAARRTDFDLERGPLVRATLLRLEDEHHILFMVVHHIILDGGTIEVLTRELCALYPSMREGLPDPLPPLERQYRDFTRWQRERFESGALEPELAYWRDKLADCPPPVSLLSDGSLPTPPSDDEGQVVTLLTGELLDGLRALRKTEGVSLFTVLLSALSVLLTRYTGQEDVAYGMAYGRRPEEFAGLLGNFINTLLLRTDLSGDPSFRTVLQRTQETSQQAYRHAEVPFEMVVKEAQLRAGATGAQLVPVFCNAVDVSRSTMDVPSLQAERIQTAPQDAPFELNPLILKDTDRVSITWIHDARLFRKGTIERLARHYVNLLAAVVADADTPVSALPLIDEVERRQLLELHGPGSDSADDRCLHEVFEEQARRTPDRVALVFGDERLTYAELDARADGFALRLQGLGVARDQRVGVFLERGPEMLVALLGILKAGGAYVPLDPTYPEARLAHMVADSGLVVLVTQAELAGRLGGFDGVVLDAAEAAQPAADGAHPVAGAGPDDLAYVIYTSGSTGLPKGVAVPHRGVVNLLASMARRPGLTADDVLCAVTTISFDIHVMELFLPLSVGARLVLATREEAADGQRLQRLMQASGTTTLQATPATWHLLLQAGWQDPSLRMICGGEALPRPLARQLLEAGGELWNVYGPTETTVWATVHRVRPGDGPVSIGRPVNHTRTYILDARGEPVPLGVAGELCIGGPQVVRGYLDRPELTAERFVPDPFDSRPGARMYRTGDLARYDAEGRIEFLGRMDGQVKLRGFRIELGEIEAVLASRDDVEQAVVTLGDVAGEKALVAYLVASPEGPPDLDSLRTTLSARLPDYMVPGAFAFLESLPLTPAGKVDRKHLGELQARLERARTEYEAPRDEDERALAEIFQELLDVERVGIHDSFFQLGGHSLLGIRLGSRIREGFGVDVSLSRMFALPTLADLAGAIREQRGQAGPRASAVPLEPVPRDPPPPASGAQRRLWLLDQLGTGAAYNIPLVLRLRGRLDADALGRAVGALVDRHEALRTGFGMQGEDLVQLVADRAEVPLERVECLGLDEARRRPGLQELAAERTGRPFDLSRAPLLRATLVRLDDDDHALILVVHHIVADGWSLEVMARDLAALYGGFVGGEDPGLPPLAVQFADVAAWQRRVVDDACVADLLDSWKRELGTDLPDLELLTDRPRPATQTFAGDTCAFALDEVSPAALQDLARQHGATVVMVCLAAWQALLARYTGQDRIVVGSPSAGRGQPESEPLVGFFVNSLVLPVDLSGDPSFAELLARVKAVSLAALDHEALPFETLVDALDPTRDASRTPLFQVTFAMQPELVVDGELPGITIEPLTTRARQARFDLELHLVHGERGLHGRLIHNTDLFDADTIERLVAHYRALLAGAVAAPATPLSRLPLLDEDEHRRTVATWNDTATDYPREATVPELFEEQARGRPEAPALRFGDRDMTYGELSRRSDALARALRDAGVGPGVFVGVRLERDVEFIIALLGVLKAGGTYVPLDPEYPARRVAYMLADTGAPVLLTQRSLQDGLPPYDGTVMLLDGDPVPDGGGEAPERGTEAGDLAYVIYTSGSTGEPKGVCVPHRAIVRLVVDTDYVDLGPDDRIGQASITSFDAATFEIWGALLNGGCLVGVPKEVALDPDRMGEHLRRECIDTLFVTTALFNQLVSRRPDTFASLRDLLFGGEAVDPRWVRAAQEHGAPERLLHVYGPTENTTFSTWFEVREVPEGARTVPIGRPVANTTAHVLDRHDRPVPVGVPGELWLGGDGLADGYLGAPEMTASRWVELRPDGGRPERLYRTGDRVRRLESGDIEFLSRMDQQVKVRGHRIEPGEVELALLASPAVGEATVIVREDSPGDKRLVAYVVAAAGGDVSPGSLRGFLREALPAYMIPTAFVALDELPLNPNGKVDKAALPVPLDRQLDTEAVAPRTETETRVAAIWRELLKLDDIGVHDDFFELGGHSLLGMQAISRLRDEFGLSLPLSILFDDPTVAGLAAGLEAVMAVQQGGADSEEDGDRVEIDF